MKLLYNDLDSKENKKKSLQKDQETIGEDLLKDITIFVSESDDLWDIINIFKTSVVKDDSELKWDSLSFNGISQQLGIYLLDMSSSIGEKIKAFQIKDCLVSEDYDCGERNRYYEVSAYKLFQLLK